MNNNWRRVEEGKPKQAGEIWAYTKLWGEEDEMSVEQLYFNPDGGPFELCYEDEGQWKGTGSEAVRFWTHWKPITFPDPPEEVAGKTTDKIAVVLFAVKYRNDEEMDDFLSEVDDLRTETDYQVEMGEISKTVMLDLQDQLE